MCFEKELPILDPVAQLAYHFLLFVPPFTQEFWLSLVILLDGPLTNSLEHSLRIIMQSFFVLLIDLLLFSILIPFESLS